MATPFKTVTYRGPMAGSEDITATILIPATTPTPKHVRVWIDEIEEQMFLLDPVSEEATE